ncbi:hypothetical protein QR64_16105 [Rhodococcus sp. Chr-9]|uniref:Uncharacterized protein n=1 Tax=Rhodococcus pyridinivorans AK37 TaxID=1114960 RepID=H0JYW3_9NOCA|nr:hypothetical protein AK37_24811 [Rhodococcus pyridinivorans AK37]KHJ71804.1 hypothetical protein QR64_16105 [Rhodococcus sp. Chr-9]
MGTGRLSPIAHGGDLLTGTHTLTRRDHGLIDVPAIVPSSWESPGSKGSVGRHSLSERGLLLAVPAR